MCESFWERLEIVDSQIQGLYNEMLEAGVARECARNILPLYTPTRMHMSGTIRSFIHYVGLRGKDDTQLEHREIARSIGYRLGRELPTVIKAVKESGDSSLAGWDFLRYLPQSD
jgi:thymidylate synthase (FAD)